ncbi:hypothetical protein SOVF_077470 isoform B [Spinacia oleracea]|nr:hypothetical protein SOVF_077470 isoform B [Spinacia oleracea]
MNFCMLLFGSCFNLQFSCIVTAAFTMKFKQTLSLYSASFWSTVELSVVDHHLLPRDSAIACLIRDVCFSRH